MAITIGIGIQKGGVGKTTTCGIFAQLLALQGKRVLAVDLDSQGNLTEFLSGEEDIYIYTGKTVFEAMKIQDPKGCIVTVKENLDLLPAEDFLSFFSQWLWRDYKGDMLPLAVLRETLKKVDADYDYILLDLPPNLGDVTLNGMAASKYMLTIMECARWCFHSLSRYLEMVDDVNLQLKNQNIDGCNIVGVLRSVVNSLRVNDKLYSEKALEEHGALVINTILENKARVREFALTGISERTTEDRAALKMYKEALAELLKNIELYEGN